MKNTMIVCLFGLLMLGTTCVYADLLTVGHGTGYDYKTITHAMAAASSGDRITVVAGTYSADNPEYPEVFPIQFKAGVTLIRASEDVQPVIDANGTGRIFNCIDIPENQRSWIEGFRIQGGLLSTGFQSGGGLLISDSCLMICNCEISGNTSSGPGGGLLITHGSKIELIDSEISDNSTTHADAVGGGIYVQSSEVEIKESYIHDNHTLLTGGGIYTYDATLSLFKTLISRNSAADSGGGIHFDESSASRSIEIEQCSISQNSAGHLGGGIFFSAAYGFTPFIGFSMIGQNTAQTDGAGMYIYGASPLIAFTAILENESEVRGGGFYLNAASPAIISCMFSGNNASAGAGLYMDTANPLLLNDLVNLNHAYEFGGGFYAINSTISATNLTLADNYAGDAGGAFALNYVTMTLSNSILWNNTIDEIYQTASNLEIQCSDIQGGYAGYGNIDIDPAFVSGINGDYFLSQLQSGNSSQSPCVDSGCNQSFDISYTAGDNTFRLSDSSTRTDRTSDTGIADMGFHMYRNPTECCATGCEISMPSNDFGAGDECFIDILLCNVEFDEYSDIPVFAVLEAGGVFFFAPEFDDFSFYRQTLYPGLQILHVVPNFIWPSNAGSATGIHLYAGMTNPEMTELFGEMDSRTFGWH